MEQLPELNKYLLCSKMTDSEAKHIKYSLLFTLPSIKIKTTNKKQWIKIYQSCITVLSIIVAVLLENESL